MHCLGRGGVAGRRGTAAATNPAVSAKTDATAFNQRNCVCNRLILDQYQVSILPFTDEVGRVTPAKY